MLSDGSGSQNYQNNADCAWLIAPPGMTKIALNFSQFSTGVVWPVLHACLVLLHFKAISLSP
jgi:hypothetical protein